jgi:hypothetical protein
LFAFVAVRALAVNDSTDLAFRGFWRSDTPKLQIVANPLIDSRVGQAFGLQLSMTASHKGLKWLVEVGKYLCDDFHGLVSAETGGGGQVIQKVVDWADNRHRGLILVLKRIDNNHFAR